MTDNAVQMCTNPFRAMRDIGYVVLALYLLDFR